MIYCQILYVHICMFVNEIYLASPKISLNTMESKIHSDLFFAGEVCGF